MHADIVNPLIQDWSEWATRPFSPQTSDAVIAILLGCFVLLAIALGDSTRFIKQLFNQTFAGHLHSKDEDIHTSRSFVMRVLLFVLYMTAVGVGVMYAMYVDGKVENTQGALMMIAGGALLIAAWMALKSLLFLIVNVFLYARAQINQWLRTYIDVFLFFGIGLLLVDIAAVFMQWTPTIFYISVLILLFGAEIMLFFKAFSIFFAKKHGLVQNIIYLCALEWIPLLVAGKILSRYYSIF